MLHYTSIGGKCFIVDALDFSILFLFWFNVIKLLSIKVFVKENKKATREKCHSSRENYIKIEIKTFRLNNSFLIVIHLER